MFDEIDGDVEVGGYSTGIIPWPRRRKSGRHSLILCDDLIRAVKTESSEAIQYWFGVGPVTVWKWRLALGVDRQNNAGTQKLYRDLKPAKLTEDRSAKGRQGAANPESTKRMAETKRGKPAHPNTKAALLKAATAPKPEGWGERANRWMLAGRKWHKFLSADELARARQLLRDGASQKATADAIGVAQSTILSRIRRGDLPKPKTIEPSHPRRLSADEIEKAKQMLESGNSIAYVARALGVSSTAICGRIKNGTLPASTAGTKLGGAKISRADAEDIIRMRQSGMYYKEITAITGLSFRTIKEIVARAHKDAHDP